MNPKMIWANFAVSDLNRTTKFYTDLGFKPNGASNELTSFLFGDDQLVIHFFVKEKIQESIKGEVADSHKVNEIIFTLSAQTPAQADEWAKEVENAGGEIISKPEKFGAGYYGFTFADPDGHKFNVFHMDGF